MKDNLIELYTALAGIPAEFRVITRVQVRGLLIQVQDAKSSASSLLSWRTIELANPGIMKFHVLDLKKQLESRSSAFGKEARSFGYTQ